MDSLKKSLWLLTFAVIICCVVYPLAIWTIGQLIFPFQANGSLLYDGKGKLIGSKLIAQSFTSDAYFQPRPSAASYDASASASSALAASNFTLRDRVAQAIGPIATYRNGASVGPDIDKWFQTTPGIVVRWAKQYPSAAEKIHPDAQNYFETFSKENPGKFPSQKTKTPIDSGSEIHSLFFDMWRQEHPDASLTEIPGDGVTTSGSGLDPHITLQNAEFQLERIVLAQAALLKRDREGVKKEIEKILQEKKIAPWNGLLGEPLINVLEVNLELSNLSSIPNSYRS